MDTFESTQWSLILAAGRKVPPEAHRALSELCRHYWLPLYGYVRRRVGDVHQAQDLTQDFFCRVLEKDFFAAADPARGKFRAFLLTAVKHFLVSEWEKDRALKRGGGRAAIELDFADGESRLSSLGTTDDSPEQQFDRQWALMLLDQTLARLRAEFRESGRESQFELLKPFLSGARDLPDGYSAAARSLGMSEDAVKVAAHRLRLRYREILRAEIAQTLTSSDEVDAEIRELFRALGQ